MNKQILDMHQPSILKQINVFQINQIKDLLNTEYMQDNIETMKEALTTILTKEDNIQNLNLAITGKVLQALHHDKKTKQQLKDTNKQIQILGETYHRSLSHKISEAEFKRQVTKHKQAVHNIINQEPTTFLDTSESLTKERINTLRTLGFTTIITPNAANDYNDDIAILQQSHFTIDDIREATVINEEIDTEYADTLQLTNEESIMNEMQQQALNELQRFEDTVKTLNKQHILKNWERLTCKHVFDTMSEENTTDIHPHNNPYETHANFMNGLNALARQITQETDAEPISNEKPYNQPSKLL